MEGVLGVDYGRARVGVARVVGKLAVPEKVIDVSGLGEAVEEVARLVEQGEIKRVVVGNPGGRMGEEVGKFCKKLGGRVGISVEMWDETLSSVEAGQRAIEAGMGQKRRKKWKDAMAATVMLQSYLDEKVNGSI